jgi:hypothetical protein
VTEKTELLAMLRAFLAERVQPRLQSFAAFENRIAINLLGLLEREAVRGPELRRVDEALADAYAIEGTDVPRGLAVGLRDGTIVADARLLKALKRRGLLQLAIDNPRYSGYQQGLTRWPGLAAELGLGDGSQG